MTELNKEQLSGHWIHSFEEDGPGEIVYRPHSFAFPRARGRRGFNLQADGRVLDISPGKSDLPETFSGDWNIEEEAVVINYPDGTGEHLPIKELSPGKLVIRKT
jgi:hypothetical protein